jgi:hypothetical protein
MTKLVRNTIAFVGLLISSVLAFPFVSAMWDSWVGVNHHFSTSYVWWDPAHALYATDDFLLFLITGAALPFLLNVRHPLLWALALGGAFGLTHWSMSWNWVNPEAGPIDYFWAYSEYFAPAAGAVAGTSLTLLFKKVFARNVTSQAVAAERDG